MMPRGLHGDHRALVVVAGLGFLVLTLIVAILPASRVRGTARLPGAPAPTAEQTRGREHYVKEGCGYCHTQFVRELQLDRPYGRPSIAADYAGENPPLLGSQRTGPDLANVGARQSSEIWHLMHLYDPRAVVPQSAMPAYPWYFDVLDQTSTADVVVPLPPAFAPVGKVVVPKPDGLALVRYLLSLRQVEVQP